MDDNSVLTNGNDISTTMAPDDTASETEDDNESVSAMPQEESSTEQENGDVSTTLTPLDGKILQFEEEVLELVNQHRSSGAACGGTGDFDPTHPLSMNVDLRSAARDHSNDMASRDFFDHINPDGEDPGQRIAVTGYSAATWGENIAWGQTSPEQVVASWMGSSGHCANLMRSTFTEIGIGYDPKDIWTQVFATPSTP
jgi:uncharacterized protein YkwD